MVSLIGSRDRQLEDTLRAVAGQVTVLSNLNALGSSSASGDEQHVVVIDIRDQPGVPAALAAVRRAHPLMGIIMVASRLDPATMLEAMRSGVNEFLTEPVTMDDVRAAVQQVSTLRPAKRGKTYAFIGAKGGVGTTTLAVNVATALARAKIGRVLMIDLHPAYGDAALFFGADPRFSVLDGLENTNRLDDAFLKSLVAPTQAGPDLLASSDRAMAMPLDAQRVRTLLDFVTQAYDHVVVDVPRSDSSILETFESVTTMVIVANQELSAIRGAARMAAALRQRYGKERVQIVVSRYDTDSQIGQEDIERVTGGSIHHLFPSNYRLAVDASNKGQPLVVENHNKLAASFTGFARSLAGVAGQAESGSPKSAGLFGRLTGRV